ncbi:MAG: hypothetical protein DRJ42_15850 [Deltaproteobacteria bacterium]|nr:MAG: hypothetical protein DRJ42_15850 [Deltaproteobacteria bacterium]
MPRLCRIHFASIGHQDARLAPLYIDLREERGQATDSVLWLRNGGGKSSVLNLFFSIFRPNLNDFLGKSGEGQSRHLGDYVKGTDTAFVVTEWELDHAQGDLNLGHPPTRIVGQVLEWRGRQRSSDTSRLQRRFFTLRTDGDLEWSSLPVQGISEAPVASAEAFVAWLRSREAERPAREVVVEENQSKWVKHLEGIHLDPELFKYQLQMNRREGAADELFRFTSARSFIEFFLELTLDPKNADQVSATLRDFRVKLARLPERKLERDFAVAAREALGPLLDAIRLQKTAETEVEQASAYVRSVAGGLNQAADRRGADRDATAERLQAHEDARRTATNDERTIQRWAQGIERRAVRLDVTESRAAAEAAAKGEAEARRRLRLLEGCGPLRRSVELNSRARDLREKLAQEESDRAPLFARLGHHGAVLRLALRRAEQEARGRADKYGAESDAADGLRLQAQEQATMAAANIAGAGKDLDAAEMSLAKRDRARERLVKEGVFEAREPAEDAQDRWQGVLDRAEERLAADEARANHLEAELEALGERLQEVSNQRVQRKAEATAAGAEFDRARMERAELEADPLVCGVEETEQANALASGLEGRLRGEASGVDAARIRSAVDGAEDVRAARGCEEEGLLPAPLDVERVRARLRAAGINAYPAAAYLAENLHDDDELKASLIRSDPARFFGVLVPHEEWARVAAVESLAAGLRMPVTIAPTSLNAPEGTSDAIVVGPGTAGGYHYAAAAGERTAIEERVESRREREDQLDERSKRLRRLADRVEALAETWGDGRYDGLRERVDMLTAEAQRLELHVVELEAERMAARGGLADLRKAQEASRRERQHAELAVSRTTSHIEHFERHVAGWRAEAAEARSRVRLETENKAEADAAIAKAMEARDGFMRQRQEARRLADDCVREHDGVSYSTDAGAGPDGGDRKPLLLDTARSRYNADLEAYERELGNSRIQGQLDEIERSQREAENQLRRIVDEHISRADVAATSELVGEHLDAREREARTAAEEATGARRAAGDRHAQAQKELKKRPEGQRQAEDLPTDRPIPDTAEGCRRCGDELRVELEGSRGTIRTLGTEIADARAALDEHRRAIDALVVGVQRIREACDVEPGPATPLPESAEEIESVVVAAIQNVKTARGQEKAAQKQVDRAVEAVRGVVREPRFASHESAWKQRLLDEAEVLGREAPRWDAGLRERIGALDHEIDNIEQDRQGIIVELLTVAEDGLRLLKDAERASRLPDGLGPWAGQSFLRVGLDVPAGEDERRARLEPLIDELVEAGRVPSGLALAQQAIIRLHGSRGFRVTILKPEASRRLDRVPIEAMVNFSGGERLTAAILLYCTLVRLRARRRGRRGGVSGNVLVLDNPIGTCSSVPLIELQREVARAMGTQLVYTTGVDDLAALAQLPNVVRLRNVHRSRSTGDLHVTVQEGHVDGRVEGRVEGVRIARRESPRGTRGDEALP